MFRKLIIFIGIFLVCLSVFVVADLSKEEAEKSIITYTSTTDTICQNGKCTKTLWSGVRNVYEDNQWKRIENARSLKDAWDVVYLSKSDNFVINLVDYNYTHIKGNLSSSQDLDDEELEFEIYTNETKFKYKFKPKDGEIEFEFDTMKLWNVTPLGLIYHFDPKETLGTTNAIHNNDGDVTSTVNTDNGVGSDLNAKNAEYIDFIAWNDSVPVGYRINAINFTVDVQNVDDCFGLAVQHNKTGSFVTECSWADVDAQNPLVCSFNVDGWWTQDVNDLSIRLLSSDCDGGGPDHGEIDYGYMFVDYANPTTIQLQDADTENLRDTYVDSWSSLQDTNKGTVDYMRLRGHGAQKERIYLQFNISSVPFGSYISNSIFCAYQYGDGTNPGGSLSHVYGDKWYNSSDGSLLNETTITWNNQPCGTGFDNSTYCNLSVQDTQTTAIDETWVCWNVKELIQINLGIYNNLSMVIRSSTEGASDSEDIFRTKEYSSQSFRPYLNITYSEAAPLSHFFLLDKHFILKDKHFILKGE